MKQYQRFSKVISVVALMSIVFGMVSPVKAAPFLPTSQSAPARTDTFLKQLWDRIGNMLSSDSAFLMSPIMNPPLSSISVQTGVQPLDLQTTTFSQHVIFKNPAEVKALTFSVFSLPSALSFVKEHDFSYVQDDCYYWTDGEDVSCTYFSGAYGGNALNYLNQVAEAGWAESRSGWSQAPSDFSEFRESLLALGWHEKMPEDGYSSGDFVLFGNDACWGFGGVVTSVDAEGPVLSANSFVAWDDGLPITTNPDQLRIEDVVSTECGEVTKQSILHYSLQDSFVYLPLIMKQGTTPDTFFVGINFELPHDWTYNWDKDQGQEHSTLEVSGSIVSPNQDALIQLSAVNNPIYADLPFGFFALPDLGEREQTFILNETLSVPIQVTTIEGCQECGINAYASFVLDGISYGVQYQDQNENTLDFFVSWLKGISQNQNADSPFIYPDAWVLEDSSNSNFPELFSDRAPTAVSYDRSAVLNYRTAYGPIQDNDDDCYLWYDGSVLRCFLTGGAYGVDGAHYLARAAAAGGLPVPSNVNDPQVKTIEGIRSFLLSHGGVEIADRSQLLPGDFVFLGRDGCYGWGGLVWTYQGSEPVMSMHSRVTWDSTGPLTTDPQNWLVSYVGSTSCGTGVNEYSYVHIDAIQDQPAPLLTQSPTFTPSTPFEGQTVEGQFTVCNYSTWAAFDASSTYIQVPDGTNFPSVNPPSLAKGDPGGCYTYTQTRAAFPTSGMYWPAAGYVEGGWHQYLTTSGAVNPRAVYVASLEDIELQGEMTVDPKDVFIGQQTSVSFTVKNVGPGAPTDNFRVAVYDENYPANPPVAIFNESGSITLNPNQTYDYSENRSFDTPGIYFIVGEHYGNGTWVPVYGNSTQILRVLYPRPEKPKLAKGMPPWIDLAGEPVNTATGNFVHEFTDLVIPLPGVSFDLTRFYNHIDAFESPGPLGYGWTWQLDWQVIWRPDKTAVLIRPDGRQTYLMAELSDSDPFGDMSGEYVGQDAEVESINRAADGTAVMQTAAHETFVFDASGYLVSFRDENGNGYDLTRDGAGRPLTFTHTNGMVINLLYTGDYLTRIELPDGTFIEYGYSAAGDLVSVTDLNGDTLQYVYDSQHRIVEFYDAAGNRILLNEYNADNQVWRQTDVDGVITIFTYDSTTRETTFVDQIGNATTYVYDLDLRLIAREDARGGVTTYDYDADFNRTEKVDANGGVWSWTYDAEGRLTSSINPKGAAWSYSYDSHGDMTQKTGPMPGQTTTITYDSFHNPIQVTDAEGNVTTRVYNDHGLVTQETNALGAVVTFSYNDMGLLTEIVEETSQGDLVSSFVYDSLGRKTAFTDALGQVTSYDYNLDHQVTSITGPGGYTVDFTYDDNGNLLQETDSLGFTRQYTYDQQDRLLTNTDPLGHVWTYAYLENGWLSAEIDPLGNTRTYTYDPEGNIATMTNPVGDVWTYDYDPVGNLIYAQDPLGNETFYTYDAANNLNQVNRPCSTCAGGRAVEVTAYNLDGTVSSYTDANGAVTQFNYDLNGRQTTLIDALGNTTTFTRDALGDIVTHTNALGHQTHYLYNEVGWLLQTTDPLGRSVNYGYDAVGQLTFFTDARGFTTSYGYDAAGRMLSQTDSLGQTTTYGYDPLGNLLSLTNPAGAKTQFSYDAKGQLVKVTNPKGHTTHYVYDALGRRTQILDALGGVHSLDYDPLGRVIQETNPAGYSRNFGYDALGRVVTSTDWEGNTTSYDYTPDGQTLAVVDPLGAQVQFVYDGNGNLTQMTDALGFETLYEYDLLDRIVLSENALGQTTQFIYDAIGHLISTQTPNGAVSSFSYDAASQLVAEIDPAGQETTYEYDFGGNTTRVIDRNGHATSYAYDGLGRVQNITDALGNAQNFTYDLAGDLVSQEDRLGNITTYTFDSIHQVSSVTNALGETTSFTYDPLGRNTIIENALGAQTTFAYDSVGNMTAVTLPGGQQTQYAYDGNGLQVFSTDARGFLTTFVYDARQQLVSETDPLGNAWQYAYNPRGDLIQEVDAEGNTTSYGYDPLGRLIQVTDPLGYESQYAYDVMGNLVKAADANGHETQYAYDILNRMVSETNPLGAVWSYDYDAEGNLQRLVDANGQTIQYGFDALDRLTEVHYPESGESVAYDYDANGNLITMVDSLGASQFTYDALNRLVAQTDPFGRVISTGYDALGQRTHWTYPSGDVLGFDYDANGWLSQVTIPDGQTASYAYNADGQPVDLQMPNGVDMSWAYDEAGRLTALAAKHQTEMDPFQSFAYTLDGNGYITQSVETFVLETGTQTISKTYGYNERYELTDTFEGYTGLAGKGVSTSYTYDPAGNRLSMATDRMLEGSFESADYFYDEADQLVQAGDTQYAYDRNGNRTEKLTGEGQITQFTYDVENRLVGIESAFNDTLLWQQENQYDGLGRRMAQGMQASGDVGMAWRQYAVAGLGFTQLAEYENDGLSAQLYRGLNGDLLSGASFSGGSSDQVWFLTDELGTARGALDNSGAWVDQTNYDAYGNRMTLEGSPQVVGNSLLDRYGFQGEEVDNLSGLVYYGARFYDPEVGRWLSQDPVRGQAASPLTRNRYLFTRNNPINRGDVDGFFDYKSGRVQWGDTWESIANQWGVSVGELQRMNPWVSQPTVGDYLALPECRSAQCQLMLGITDVRIGGISGTVCTQRLYQRQMAYKESVRAAREEYEKLSGEILEGYYSLGDLKTLKTGVEAKRWEILTLLNQFGFAVSPELSIVKLKETIALLNSYLKSADEIVNEELSQPKKSFLNKFTNDLLFSSDNKKIIRIRRFNEKKNLAKSHDQKLLSFYYKTRADIEMYSLFGFGSHFDYKHSDPVLKDRLGIFSTLGRKVFPNIEKNRFIGSFFEDRFSNNDTRIQLQNSNVTRDDYGNYAWGYIGREAGYSQSELIKMSNFGDGIIESIETRSINPNVIKGLVSWDFEYDSVGKEEDISLIKSGYLNNVAEKMNDRYKFSETQKRNGILYKFLSSIDHQNY